MRLEERLRLAERLGRRDRWRKAKVEAEAELRIRLREQERIIAPSLTLTSTFPSAFR